MTGKEYQTLAMRTRNTELTDKETLMNGVMGLSGESGECADIVKKYAFQGHEMDAKHLLEELGDVMWYVALTAEAVGIDLDEIMLVNIMKLDARYHGAFSVAKSVNRPEVNI